MLSVDIFDMLGLVDQTQQGTRSAGRTGFKQTGVNHARLPLMKLTIETTSPFISNKKVCNHKFHAPSIHSAVVVSIQSVDIIWIYGSKSCHTVLKHLG
jgi:hypothetical protein